MAFNVYPPRESQTPSTAFDKSETTLDQSASAPQILRKPSSIYTHSDSAIFNKPQPTTPGQPSSAFEYNEEHAKSSRPKAKLEPRIQVTSDWRNPKRWNGSCWIGLSFVVLIVLGLIFGISLHVSRLMKYPDYTRLDYRLVDTYSGEAFFDKFDYFTCYDPALGLVHYANPGDAELYNLTYATSSTAVLRVNNRDQRPFDTGRLSVRIESKATFNSGLFIFDVKHAPFGCALWPALWLTDRYHWPLNGEIDVLEGTNIKAGNQVTLHTTKGCEMNVRRKQTGRVMEIDCYNGTKANVGCGIAGDDGTYGPDFNAAGGGLYALELRDVGIRTWFFPRHAVPSELAISNLKATSSPPDPSKWPGQPLADFPNTKCNIGNHFTNLSIIANIDLCGQWAGQDSDFIHKSGCPDTGPGSCDRYVKTQPGYEYDEAYWEFGGFWVFQAQ